MWTLLFEIFILIGTSYLFGIIAQRLRQSAIIGYLLAGSVVGPLLFNRDTVTDVAELGVALLLFSIGLEFSFRQLKALGKAVLFGGTLQVLLTLAVVSGVLALFLSVPPAVVVGAGAALSSTAIVLRVLVDRAEVDSVRGRISLGILLVQDLAVVPLVILVSVVGEGNSGGGAVLMRIGKIIIAAGGLMTVFYLLFYHGIPWLLKKEGLFANRDLTILLAILSALGAISGAHAVGLSPALGAFVAGMLLAESPFAAQIRADIDTIRALFVTLFFTSIGMLLDVGWLIRHIHQVLPVVGGVFVAKAGIIFLILRILRFDTFTAMAAGITLGQIGEFAFVLATAARDSGTLSPDLFAGIVSVTLISMFLAPYMVAYAEPLAGGVMFRLFGRSVALPKKSDEPTTCKSLIIGFGPAGRQVAEGLLAVGMKPEVLELNPSAINVGKQLGVHVHMGDASRPEVLAHAGVREASVVVVTLPDSRAVKHVIENVRALAPNVHIIARGRYHRYIQEIADAGAQIVVDEEHGVGKQLAEEAVAQVNSAELLNMACRLMGKQKARENKE